MRIVVDEREHNGVEQRLGHERRTWGERQEDAGCQDEKQHCSKKGHHWVKHDWSILVQ